MNLNPSFNGTTIDSGTLFSLYERWLASTATPSCSGNYIASPVRGAGLPTSQQVCVNLLLTGALITGGIVGIGQMAGTTGISGICGSSIYTSSGPPYVVPDMLYILLIY
jgi:hypothetical protein